MDLQLAIAILQLSPNYDITDIKRQYRQGYCNIKKKSFKRTPYNNAEK